MGWARARELGSYLISFVLGRGALFTAPLLLANLLEKADYGSIETAQAMASVTMSITSAGTASLIPLVVLAQADTTRLGGIVAHHLGLVIVCLALALCALGAGLPLVWPLAALLTAALTLQSLGSTQLKTLGHSEASILLDAGLFALMALAAVGARWTGSSQVIGWVVAAVCVYCTSLFAFYARILQQERMTGASLRWRGAIVHGLPLMMGGMVSLLATTSGRLGMGMLAGPVLAADYALLSRAAALPIIAHQLILIARFRHLFLLPHEAVERAAVQIVAMVALSAVGFVLLVPWLGPWLGPVFVKTWAANRLAGCFIAAQATLWSAIALNDLIISRHQAMARILPFSASFILLALGAGWWALRYIGIDLLHFIYVHAAVMLMFYVVQSIAMAATGAHYWRVWAATVVMYASMILLACTLKFD